MTSISFARVIATYKTRSSSAIVWRVFFSAIAMRARDGKYARFSISTTFAPIYSELSSSTLIRSIAPVKLPRQIRQKHHRKFQSLRLVDGHDLHSVVLSRLRARRRQLPLSSSSSIYRKKPIRL